jgi:hypothetical protein
MARAKRKTFGSPPAAHRAQAREAGKAARWWAKEFRKQLGWNNCHSALDSLLTFNRMSAQSTVERGHATGRGGWQARMFKSMKYRFGLKCVLTR